MTGHRLTERGGLRGEADVVEQSVRPALGDREVVGEVRMPWWNPKFTSDAIEWASDLSTARLSPSGRRREGRSAPLRPLCKVSSRRWGSFLTPAGDGEAGQMRRSPSGPVASAQRTVNGSCTTATFVAGE